MQENLPRVLQIFAARAANSARHLHENGVRGAMMMHHMRETMHTTTSNDNVLNQYQKNLYIAKQFGANCSDSTRDNRLFVDIGSIIHSNVDFSYTRYNSNLQSMTAPGSDFTQTRFMSNSTSTTMAKGPAAWTATPMQRTGQGPIFQQRVGTENVYDFFPKRSLITGSPDAF